MSLQSKLTYRVNYNIRYPKSLQNTYLGSYFSNVHNHFVNLFRLCRDCAFLHYVKVVLIKTVLLIAPIQKSLQNETKLNKQDLHMIQREYILKQISK